MSQITLSDLQAAAPAGAKNAFSQATVDLINQIAVDPETAEYVRGNIISYVGVLKDGKYKAEDYINAVTYVSFKLMGDSNQEAWSKTFPARHQRLIQNGVSSKDISAHVSAYNRGKLVNAILEQSLVPVWVMNQDLHQKAINQLAVLMMTATSEKVQSDSAIGLINALKKPDSVKADLNIVMEDNSGMNDMKKALADMAQTQRQLIESGIGIKTITGSKIIEAEAQSDGTH